MKGLEIERRWHIPQEILPKLSTSILHADHRLITQWYTPEGRPRTEVLHSGGLVTEVTIKTPDNSQENVGLQAHVEDINHVSPSVLIGLLFKHRQAPSLIKHRFKIRYGERVIELDFFTGAITGLVLAEVEFPNASIARDFREPSWFGHEVTNLKTWKNYYLALRGLPNNFERVNRKSLDRLGIK